MKQTMIRLFCALSAAFACSWLLPQIFFRDCVRVVLPQNKEIREEADEKTNRTTNERETAQTYESTLDEDDFLNLFDFQKSPYKVTWKFF